MLENNLIEFGNRHLSKPAYREKFKGDTAHGTAAYTLVREDASTGSTSKLPLESKFGKMYNDVIDTPHYIGHRKRVKERFVAAGAEHFSDYALLAVMLFSAIPRKDVKPLAKKLLDHFDITDLINLDKERLLSIKGTNENLYINFV
ncbi:hypothetical protein KNCP2_02620 [Candidatus Rickettsia kedanie]|uniref:UPF0758 domain-containing protein n=1 Tax=Candidatus Rickettsia kedanie TaxID=3115352 RepID=A0ABP9TWH4_9RICK